MTTAKTVTVVLAGALAGLLIGFGATTLATRQAVAQHATDPLGLPASLQLDTSDPANAGAQVAAATGAGVGDNFVTQVYKKVSPAVVHVTNRSQQFDIWTGPFTAEATGSGVIVDANGYILTNFHVIEGAEEIIVVLNDGREYTAKKIGEDPGTDLALLKIDAKGKLPVATLGDSTALQVGEWVVAIGNPKGLDWTVTVGVVSALGREIVAKTGQTLRGMIQTDAAINPGNSGGPLLNTKGEVIGINDAIISGTGESIGIGLAIPVNTAKTVLEDMVKHGRVIRPWLGIEASAINKAAAARYNSPVAHGIIPRVVYRDSPAARAGIIPYHYNEHDGQMRFEIIVAVDGQKINSERELLDIIRNKKPGDKVKIDLYSAVITSPTNATYTAQTVEVSLTELPAEAPMMGII